MEKGSSAFLDILPYIISVICALVSGFVSWLIAHNQSKHAIEELEKKYKLDYEQYKNQGIYEIRKKVIFRALTFFDDYISWLTVDGEKPIRKQDCSTHKFTVEAREIYNELCVTVENQELINSFNKMVCTMTKLEISEIEKFRKEARKELGLSEIDFPENTVFICRVSTDDLGEKEN